MPYEGRLLALQAVPYCYWNYQYSLHQYRCDQLQLGIEPVRLPSNDHAIPETGRCCSASVHKAHRVMRVSAVEVPQAGGGALSIRLTADQVAQIVHDATANSGLASIRARFLEGRPSECRGTGSPELYYDKKLSRSMLQGLMVLCVFADGRDHAVAEVVTALDMPTSTVYRHARTWAAVRVLELDTGSGSYRLASTSQAMARREFPAALGQRRKVKP